MLQVVTDERGAAMVVEVGYARAWDLEARVSWRPISVEEARERDAAGLPYVVVYQAVGQKAPLEVRLVSWRDHYVGLWIYDAQGRRTCELDMRLLDDPTRLLRRYAVRWHYTGPEMAEFDEACPRSTVDLFPDGSGRRTEESRGKHGGSYITVPRVSDDERWTDRPAFGEWPLFSARSHGLTEPPVFDITEPPVAATYGNGLAPTTCWRPPRPAQPGPISELFHPGVRVTDGYHPEMTVVEPRRIGTLRVPSGLLAVSGPDIDKDGPHITIPVPPGEYVLQEAQVRHTYHCEWEEGEVTRTETTALRVLISEAPAVTWEMALRPDDDRRLFIEDQISGFDTHGATGCFADAGAWGPLIALFEKGMIRGVPDLDPDVYEDISDSMFLLRTRDRAAGGELAAFATIADGTYPVWVGRSGTGAVVAVVVLVEGMPDLLPEGGATAGD
ncbi:uncharacterized protein DUF4241 [Streptomyces sp. KhCrAH-43]|uniref:DUF4241 domain-containing protein n=1 Tax=unclassified Streptomyces TaxID=2593676 RepID=UPI000683D6B0|nr:MULTISPECIES: DUF4241 domain-containing protein [unclassified Streptomyces]RAJ50748.1 uncharacterized protein DUF4241 [Streptomyces sp. KhCrAH-43]